MTLSQEAVIDWLGLEKDTGDVVLMIVDDLDWSDEQDHIRQFQQKINLYADVIDSGEVFERVSQIANRDVSRTTPVKIVALMKYPVNQEGGEFLDYVKSRLAVEGITFDHRIFKSDQS